jgi:excisionase family DNA binding protein
MVTVVGDGTYLTVGEAAEWLNISPTAVRDAIDRGELKAWRTPGGHRRVDPESVKRLRAKGHPEPEQNERDDQ